MMVFIQIGYFLSSLKSAKHCQINIHLEFSTSLFTVVFLLVENPASVHESNVR